MHQRLERPDPRTYVGSGKLQELRFQIAAAKADTIIFDDELAPKQSKKIEEDINKVKRCRVADGEEETVRIADRTELILDIFQQRASTKEARLQVEMARLQCQLPRLTKKWSHLERERQSGKGTQKGMGEKQIEVDKRQIRSQISGLRKKIDDVRKHRRQHRRRRAKSEIPVVSCVGYTNAGKSTLLNQLSTSRVRVEDQLFATLDPTTRRVELPRGKQALLTDTVGFIQKLPTQLVAAFRATLEEIKEAHLLLHVVDVSDPNAPAQVEAANSVLEELGATNIPQVMVWNKMDTCEDTEWVQNLASSVNSVCISARTGEGLRVLRERIEYELSRRLIQVQAQIPWKDGELYDELSQIGVIESVSWEFEGITVKASVPVGLSKRLLSYAV
jgi:GTP-binding protein HflX